VITDAVLLIVGQVGVARPVDVPERFVVFAPSVLVADEDPDRGPSGAALEDPGDQLRDVVFVPRGGECTLARTTAGHIAAEVLGRQGQARRATIDDHQLTRAVGLAGGRDP
jgi:hypothetical protein